MDLQQLVKQTEKLVLDNSPAILTAIGVTGTVTCAYLTGRASFKAAEVLAEQSKIGGFYKHEMDTREKVQLTWKLYVPAAVSGSLTIVCIIAANRIGTRRAAALAAAYTLSEKAFTEYREKIIEKIGSSKEQKARDEIAQEQLERTAHAQSGIMVIGAGNVLCFDAYTGRYFESSMETIKKAQNDTNYQLLSNMYASLGDLYERIGISSTPFSEEVGWNVDNQVEILFSTALSDDGRPCLVLNYRVVPIRGYSRLQ